MLMQSAKIVYTTTFNKISLLVVDKNFFFSISNASPYIIKNKSKYGFFLLLPTIEGNPKYRL